MQYKQYKQYKQKKWGGGEKEAANNGEVKDPDPALEQTRTRMARIDAFLNTIPAQYILGFDHPLVKREKLNYDPYKAKSTAALLMEAAELDANPQAVEEASAAAARRNRKTASGKKVKLCQGKRRKLKGSAEAKAKRLEQDPTSEVATRKELHERLERKLAELREERRKKQTEAEKAKAAQRRVMREAASKAGTDSRQSNEEIQSLVTKRGLEVAREAEAAAPEAKRAKVKAPAKLARAAAQEPQSATEEDNESGPEVGRIVFEPAKGDLPFDATINSPGEKMRRMRTELRKQEQEAEKLRRATAKGQGEELRSNFAMQKALLRVQGHKVHDDSKRLRQAQKSLDVRKKKGREKRELQKENVRKEQEERQLRRKENLKQRSANKKKNKQRSGFEGKRDGFLNSEVPAVTTK